jgi:cytochrome c oxidase subunit 4
MSGETHDVRKEIKRYLIVFAALLALTVITVIASNFHFGVTLGVMIALIIASFKGYLVACNFMHLSNEKKVVYLVLILAAVFIIAMMILFISGHYNLPQGAHYVS